jgi:CheY-like chemotaxis protein
MERAHVLIVEDNPIEREGLGVILAREGFDVTLMSDGAAALDHLRRHPVPDLIVLDMFLPVLDGWRFLEQLSANPLSEKPRIIIATGNLIIGRDWALSHDCDGFLRKPIDFDEMLQEVRRCLGDRPAAKESAPRGPVANRPL